MLILLCSGNFSSPVHAAASSNRITQPYCASGDNPCITFSIPSDHTQIIYDWTTAGHRHDTIQVGYSVLSRTSTGKSIVLNDWRQHETLIGYGEDSIPVIYENAVYGDFYQAWTEWGRENGWLGFPKSDQEPLTQAWALYLHVNPPGPSDMFTAFECGWLISRPGQIQGIYRPGCVTATGFHNP